MSDVQSMHDVQSYRDRTGTVGNGTDTDLFEREARSSLT